MSELLSILQLVATAMVVLRMVIVGWLQPPGKMLSWPMFTRGVYVLADLRTCDGQAFDIYDLRSEHLAAMSVPEFQSALEFARDELQLCIEGTAAVLHANGSTALTIENSHVVP